MRVKDVEVATPAGREPGTDRLRTSQWRVEKPGPASLDREQTAISRAPGIYMQLGEKKNKGKLKQKLGYLRNIKEFIFLAFLPLKLISWASYPLDDQWGSKDLEPV